MRETHSPINGYKGGFMDNDKCIECDDKGVINTCIGDKWEWQVCLNCSTDIINFQDELRVDRLQEKCNALNKGHR